MRRARSREPPSRFSTSVEPRGGRGAGRRGPWAMPGAARCANRHPIHGGAAWRVAEPSARQVASVRRQSTATPYYGVVELDQISKAELFKIVRSLVLSRSFVEQLLGLFAPGTAHRRDHDQGVGLRCTSGLSWSRATSPRTWITNTAAISPFAIARKKMYPRAWRARPRRRSLYSNRMQSLSTAARRRPRARRAAGPQLLSPPCSIRSISSK